MTNKVAKTKRRQGFVVWLRGQAKARGGLVQHLYDIIVADRVSHYADEPALPDWDDYAAAIRYLELQRADSDCLEMFSWLHSQYSAKGKPLTMEEHYALAESLNDIQYQVFAIAGVVRGKLPLGSPAHRKVNALFDAVGEAKYIFDGLMYETEDPERSPYYGRARKGEKG
jgi:hypothetical protein